VFKFLELHEKVSFPEAVKMLGAEIRGLAARSRSTGAATTPGATRRSGGAAQGARGGALYFREQLAAGAGARARQQLKERDVTPKTIEQLGLGYAPQSRDG
jgi:DNA primase